MNAKPKRKNTPDTNSVEFVTALSVEECVDRLERGPARTLDHRLSVRVDEQRFAVDAQIESGNALMVVAELRGDLIQLQNKRTRVRATQIKKNPLDTARRWVIIPVMGSTGGTLGGYHLRGTLGCGSRHFLRGFGRCATFFDLRDGNGLGSSKI